MKNRKFNLLDIFIILVILVCVVGAGFRFLGSSSKLRSKNSSFDYVIKVGSLRQCSVDAIKKAAEENAQITDDVRKNAVGNVYAYEVVPARDYVTKDNGERVLSDVPERFDVYIYVRSVGEVTDQSYITKSGNEILIDRETYYTTCWNGFYGEVWDVGLDLSAEKYN